MKAHRVWHGVRMRTAMVGSDPDAPPRRVTWPASWNDSAAAALASLVSDEMAANLAMAADGWIRPVSERARLDGDHGDIATRLHGLILRRQAVPTAPLWRLRADPVPREPPGAVLNLPAFDEPGHGFDVAGYAEACGDVALALRLAFPAADRFAIGFADLDGLLANLGLPYESPAARDIAACLACLLRARVDQTLAGAQHDLLATAPTWPTPPAACAIDGLAAAAHLARRTCRSVPGQLAATAIGPAGPAEALLGAETGGFAPAFSPIADDDRLTRAAQARLAANFLSPEAAFAAVLRGETVFPIVPVSAHAAMHDAIAPFIDAMPARPAASVVPVSRAIAEPLPARRSGYVRKANVGGHKVVVRTGEYPDGRLGEITVAAPRESAAFRGLLDALGQAVSIGLQHGVPIEAFIEALTFSAFGPGGQVEDDPAVPAATSVVDYVFRNLAVNYVGRPVPAPDLDTDDSPSEARWPMLPLDLPVNAVRGLSPRARRRTLRLVG